MQGAGGVQAPIEVGERTDLAVVRFHRAGVAYEQGLRLIP